MNDLISKLENDCKSFVNSHELNNNCPLSLWNVRKSINEFLKTQDCDYVVEVVGRFCKSKLYPANCGLGVWYLPEIFNNLVRFVKWDCERVNG